MKSHTKIICKVCKDKGYVEVKCLIQDYKRKCLCCNGERKDESFRKLKADDLSSNR